VTEDALRKSIVAEAAKSTAAKPKVGPAEDIASPKPKAPSESKSKVAAAAPCDGHAEDAKSQVTCIAMILFGHTAFGVPSVLERRPIA
jgi:hypothetical protein